MEAELHADSLGRQVEETRHLLAGDVATRGLVDLDQLRARRDEAAQLRVDDLGEALGDVHDVLVDLARVDPRAEGERPGARRLRVAGRVPLEVLELADDPEAAGRRRDAPDGLVARLLIVAPRAGLATHRQGLDALDDRVVGIDVAVQAPDLAVGDDVDAGSLHVADRGVGGVVEHFLEVAVAEVAPLEGTDGGEPPAGLSVGADDGARDQGERHGQDSPCSGGVIATRPQLCAARRGRARRRRACRRR